MTTGVLSRGVDVATSQQLLAARVREANRKPISGAQRPQPATRHLVRQRLLRRLHTRETAL